MEPSIRLQVTVINQLNDPNDNDQCITTQAGQTITLNDQGIKKSFILFNEGRHTCKQDIRRHIKHIIVIGILHLKGKWKI